MPIPVDSSARAPEENFHVWLNKRICRVSDKGDVGDIFKLMEEFFPRMNSVNMSTALHRIAVSANRTGAWLDQSNNALLRQVLQRVDGELAVLHLCHSTGAHKPACGTYRPRCLATIAWACAKLQSHDKKLFRHIALVATPIVPEFKTIELAKLIWAFAKSRILEEELMEASSAFISATRGSFSPVCLASLAWASAWTFVTFQWQPSQELMNIVVEAFISRITCTGSQEIANVCWALATAKVARQGANLPFEFAEAFDIMGTSASSRIGDFAAQELCIMTWAFARVSYPHIKMLNALAALLTQHQGLTFTFHPQGLANMLWAMAKMSAMMSDMAASSTVKEIALALLPACVRVVPRLKMLELSSVVWACARLGIRSGMVPEADQIFDLISRMGSAVLANFSAQGLTNAFFAITEFTLNSSILLYRAFLGVLADTIVMRLKEFRAFSLRFLLESIQKLDQHVEAIPNVHKLADAIALRVSNDLQGFNSIMLTHLTTTADIQIESCRTIASSLAWHAGSKEGIRLDVRKAGPREDLVPSPMWMTGGNTRPMFCDAAAA